MGLGACARDSTGGDDTASDTSGDTQGDSASDGSTDALEEAGDGADEADEGDVDVEPDEGDAAEDAAEEPIEYVPLPVDVNEVMDDAGDITEDVEPLPIESCSTARLFAGNPLYAGAGGYPPNPDESPLIGNLSENDVPLAWHSLVFDGDTLFTNTSSSIWSASLYFATQNRISGHDATRDFNDGDCQMARFAELVDMSGAPWVGGRTFDTGIPTRPLLVTDWMANALVLITGAKTGEGCMVWYLVGTQEPLEDLSAEDTVDTPHYGDLDGPAATALVAQPRWPVVSDDGVIYFWDSGNRKIKAVGTDEDRTVSTLVAEMPTWDPGDGGDPLAVELTAMTILDDVIYATAYAVEGDGTGIIRFDPNDPEPEDWSDDFIAWGDSTDWQVTSPAVLETLTANGTELFALLSAGGRGYAYRIALDGTPTLLAGNDWQGDFPPHDYDVAAEHPALDGVDGVLLPISQTPSFGQNAFMAYHDGHLYVGSAANDEGRYVYEVDCP
jgi:hypothetical protein